MARMTAAIVAGALGLVGMCAPRSAHAFCGFYINGSGGEMFNNATQVVMMRSGTRTVLAMENAYDGPPSDFAMVIPVPVVLHPGDVKTLPKAVFAKVDAMSSPRLVEYWEQDPCPKPRPEMMEEEDSAGAPMPDMAPAMAKAAPRDYGVTVEAQFDVDEYQIVILSATQSNGLDAYLRSEHYKIPDGAAPLLRPYVAAGSKFFVAKVDPKKVKFEAGHAVLSPLRFMYDSEEFALPIRLGLASSPGTQDLIVNILAPGQRYELANYKNVTIPTNLDVRDGVRKRFGEFYAALFDRTIAKNPGAVVTEYAWDASSCDPCPGPTLDETDFATLGADVLGGGAGQSFVLTRLHARYGKTDMADDLRFRAASPIVGGREIRNGLDKLEQGATPSDTNNFQGRYAIRHPWTGAAACANPQRGVWGGPPDGQEVADGAGSVAAAVGVATAPRGKLELANWLPQDLPELGIKSGAPVHASFLAREGCTCGAAGASGGAGALGSGLFIAVAVWITRRRTRS